MRKNKILLLIFLFTSYHFFAQDSIALSYANYIYWVQKNHPIIKISDWEKNIAQNNILKAKALLDPNISAKIGEKKIDNTLYYSQKNIELNLPTWYGIDFNIGTCAVTCSKHACCTALIWPEPHYWRILLSIVWLSLRSAILH